MESHIFGTFSSDRLKFLHEQQSDLGVQHRARTLPRDPLPGEPCTLVVTTGPDCPAQAVVAWYTVDGSVPTVAGAQLPFAVQGRRWSTVAWGYVTTWQARLPAPPDGVSLRYRIAARLPDGAWRWADWPQPKLAVEQALLAGEHRVAAPLPAPATDFALSWDRFAPPAWAEEALIYQIFLDRFERGDGEAWPARPSLWEPHGGTLRGATQRLEHLASLGVSCLWLSPLFPSPTHHGYDATDYFEVEPRLGSKADLRALIERAHGLGMRVLLDFVCNHVGDGHPRFQRALAEPLSAERAWFWFDEAHAPHGFRSFFNVATMPELNTDHPAVRDYLTRAALMWLCDFGVDGFRLDYAHGPSHAFWTHFWGAVKQAKPDAWCFGEVVDTPDSQLGYVGRLDGVLDFHVGDGLRQVFGSRSRDLPWLDAFLRDHAAFFPPQARFSRPSFLDNHDMDRFSLLVGGDEARLRLALLFLYSLPNPPILLYGTEVALPQRVPVGGAHGLEMSREPMAWERLESQGALLAFVRRLGLLRRTVPALRPTLRETLLVTPDQWLMRHQRGNSQLLVALNRADRPATLRHAALQGAFHDLLPDNAVALAGHLTLPAHTGCLLAISG